MTDIRFPLILLDFDGTLVDSSVSISKSFEIFGENHDLRIDTGLMKHLMSQPMEVSMAELGFENIEKARNEYREIYVEQRKIHEKLYSGVNKTLKELSRISKLCIVTNKGINGVCFSSEYFNIHRFISGYYGDDGRSVMKPDPDLLEKILDDLSCSGFNYEREDILMVGDSPIDAEFAAQCGIYFAFASWGFYSFDHIRAKVHFTLNSILELIDYSMVSGQYQIEINNELDLHHYQDSEVPALVRDYIIEARKKKFREVRIIHGKGKGTIKKMVQKQLDQMKYEIIRYDTAPAYLGGEGATVVVLRSSDQTE